jgi:hypothetical protein
LRELGFLNIKRPIADDEAEDPDERARDEAAEAAAR